VKGDRDVLRERLSETQPQNRHLLLQDVANWDEKECGPKITEQDIMTTVDQYMRDVLEVSKDRQGAGWISWWKPGMSQNVYDEQIDAIGSAGGVSVNTEVWPTKLCATAEYRPRTAHQQTDSDWCANYVTDMEANDYKADMTGVSGKHTANQGDVGIDNGHSNGAPVVGGAFNRFSTNYGQAKISCTSNSIVTQSEIDNDWGVRPMFESADV